MTGPFSRRRFLATAAVSAAGLGTMTAAARQGKKTDLDPKTLQGVLDKAHAFLKVRQKEDGSFAPPQAGEPGVTALAAGALVRAGWDNTDPTVAKALKYLEGAVKPDGGVYNKGFSNYTTALAVAAFKEANGGGKYDAVIAAAGKYLRTLQYGEGDDVGDKDAKFGGAGYGKKGERGGGADLSNTHFFVEALLATGVSRDDPAVKKALAFVSRSQNLPGEFNDQEYAAKAAEEDKGGFVYTPLAAADEKSGKRTAAGGLRSEGGMTYAGLKSFLYAGVSKDDPRVKAAVAWVRKHYTLTENPGMGADGLYYYYHVFAKAMDALGEDKFADAAGKAHDWRAELIAELAKRQKPDGSWANEKSRAYMENVPELATAFAVLAMSYCKVK